MFTYKAYKEIVQDCVARYNSVQEAKESSVTYEIVIREDEEENSITLFLQSNELRLVVTGVEEADFEDGYATILYEIMDNSLDQMVRRKLGKNFLNEYINGAG